jgi:hypothetical protein
MYRIVFNPAKCEWEIQLLCFLLWRTLKGKTFPNFISAEDYVGAVGLDKVYKPYGKSFVAWVMGGAA